MLSLIDETHELDRAQLIAYRALGPVIKRDCNGFHGVSQPGMIITDPDRPSGLVSGSLIDEIAALKPNFDPARVRTLATDCAGATAQFRTRCVDKAHTLAGTKGRLGDV